jgi:outer membrane protein assembly factor BamB
LIVASDLLKLVRLSAGDSLRPLTDVDLQFPLTGPLVAVGNLVGGVQSSKSGDTFKLYNTNDLSETGSIELAGRLVAGPYALADGSCLLQTNTELLAVSSQGQKLWSRDFPYTQLVAPPTGANSRLLLVTKAGPVLLLDPASGQILGTTDAGQALSSAPLILPSGLLIGSDEGAVLALPTPTATEVQ